MSDNALKPVEPSVPVRNPERCAYCGAPLIGQYYFCLNCATPYAPVESVLPSEVVIAPTESELVRYKAPHVYNLFWTYFAVVVGVAVVMAVSVGDRRPEIHLLVQSAALLIVTCITGVLYWPALKVQFKRFGFTHPAALVGLAALAPMLGINYAYHHLLVRVLGLKDALPLTSLRDGPLGEAGLVLMICVFPAIVEEIAFRGLVQHWLQAAIKPWRAIAFASFLFGVMHFSVLSFPYIFGLSVLLGWTKWKTGSLYPSMLIHFLHNLVVIEYFS